MCQQVNGGYSGWLQQGALLPTQAGGNGSGIYSGTADLSLRTDPSYGGGVQLMNTGGEPNLVIGQYTDTNQVDNEEDLVNFNYGSLGSYMQTNNLAIKSVALKLYLNGNAGISATTGQQR